MVDTSRARSGRPLSSRSPPHAVFIPQLDPTTQPGCQFFPAHMTCIRTIRHIHWSSSVLPSRDFSNCFLMRASSCGVKRESSRRGASGCRPGPLPSCPWEDEQSKSLGARKETAVVGGWWKGERERGRGTRRSQNAGRGIQIKLKLPTILHGTAREF